MFFFERWLRKKKYPIFTESFPFEKEIDRNLIFIKIKSKRFIRIEIRLNLPFFKLYPKINVLNGIFIRVENKKKGKIKAKRFEKRNIWKKKFKKCNISPIIKFPAFFFLSVLFFCFFLTIFEKRNEYACKKERK